MIDGRYVIDHYPGIGRYVFNLMRALADAAPATSFSLLVDSRGSETRFDLQALARRGVTLLPTDAGPRSLGGSFRVRRLCRQRAPAVFHATHLLSPVRLACPGVLTIYDVIPLQPGGALSSAGGRVMYRLLLRRALAGATRILTLSEAARDDLTRLCGVAPDRITVTSAAADPAFRPASAGEVEELRSRLGLPERYVLYVGTNRPHKNLSTLVEAWARVTARVGDRGPLVVAGPEDGRFPDARRRANLLPPGTVRFTGPVAEADLPALYTGARLVVHPSTGEGFGLTVLEAMACGAPVACARIPALMEVGGDAVLSFDPASPPEMASAIGRGLDDEALRAGMVARGRERAGRFSWTRTAELTLEAYHQAGRAGRSGARAS